MKRKRQYQEEQVNETNENDSNTDNRKNEDDGKDDENEIPCDGIGDVLHIDTEDRKFYAAFQTCDLVVKLGDCVRVSLEDDSEGGGGSGGGLSNSFGFGQVLAIYENASEEILIEVRWFLQPHELSKQKKSIINPKENELIETDLLDDIPAGSVAEVIHIQGADSSVAASDHFLCRYFENSQSRATQKISVHTMFKRGLEYSHYQEAYENYLKSTNGMAVDDYSIAIQRLQISVIPDELPCRESERKFIYNYIREVVSSSRTKPPLYICGMPGTGKTATVLSCVNNLRKEAELKTIPEFDFIEINCLRLKTPADAYTQLWRGLTGYHVSAKTAQQKLSSFFSSNQVRIKTTGTENREHILVCLMDELDFLLTRDFRVIYNLFDWSMHEKSGFLLLGISNTMDLPERISARVESRTSINIQRQIFQPYNYLQVQEIIEKRLMNLNLKYFENKAIQFIARKASSTVSDLRAALQICQSTLAMFRDFLQVNEPSDDPAQTFLLNSQKNGGNDVPESRKYFKEILTMISSAVDKYKSTPFISVILQLCDLWKVILIVFCKHRRLVCGGDEHSPIAGMTAIMAWEKLTDFMSKVETDEFYRSGKDTASEKKDETAQNLGKIQLRLPPMFIFQDALTQLTRRALLSTTISYRPCGRPIIIYHLNSGLLYSDILAALNETYWRRFLLS